MNTQSQIINKYSTENCFDYENGFYLTSDPKRIGKILSHYELYKMIKDVPGDIIELGVFKGTSLINFATFRELLENEFSRKIIGFYVWGAFPETNFELDKKMREQFINETHDFLTIDELKQSLKFKEFNNIELVQGDICKTLSSYLESNPALKVSLLHIDTDIYEPAKVGLELLWEKIVRGGIIVFDDYGVFPGETKAVDDFLTNKKHLKIRKLSISHQKPVYLIKD